MWACGIRNGKWAGRIVPLESRIALPELPGTFRIQTLARISEGAEVTAPYPFKFSTHALRKSLFYRIGSRNVACVSS